MNKLYMIVSILFVLLGTVHAACTPVFYTSYSLDALWFAGTGMGVSFTGLLNISAIRTSHHDACIIAAAANIVCSIFFILLGLFIGLEIQLVAGIVLLASMLALSIYSWRRA